MTPRHQVYEELLSAFAVAVINMAANPRADNDAVLKATVKALAARLAVKQ